MDNNISIYDNAICRLDKLRKQLEKGSISLSDYEQQRLIVLVDLVIDGTNKFGKGE